MMDIEKIREAIRRHHVRVTDHADEEAAADHLSLDAVYYSVEEGEVIEDYPGDKPYPSCLIFGPAPDASPVHSVWAYNDVNACAVLITVYRPDPARWVNSRQRRKQP